jgi:leucyl-tRNA synthetase
LVARLTTAPQRPAVEAYLQQTLRQSEIQREATGKEKTGVFTGGFAINPVNDERIPVWIADYVLLSYGTGAIMAVPAHDQRDFEFARKFGLQVRPVIQPDGAGALDGAMLAEAVPAHGAMVNSGPLTGTPAERAVPATIDYLQQKGAGQAAVNYRLRDWLISRQRYWGAPIPIVYCPEHGQVAVPEADLPVLLPDDVEWRPTGESPLKLHPTWKQTTCPRCGRPAERDTDTMDTFMCSSWYHLRYLSPDFDEAPFDPREYDYWMPVDAYTGGAEHATMHLIYTRFFHKALRDMGIAEGAEPMLQLRNQGHILGPDGARMSKSRGNVVDPDEQVRRYGADVVRAYLMFGYRWVEGGPWSDENIQGVVRWLHRLWSQVLDSQGEAGTPRPSQGDRDGSAGELRRRSHAAIRQVSQDFDRYEFNTVVSGLMELTNAVAEARQAGLAGTAGYQESVETLILLLAPVAPHMAEELWSRLGKPYSVHQQAWPNFDPAALATDEITLVVQIDGKVRDRVTLPVNAGEEQARRAALASPTVQRHLEGKTVRQAIYVEGRLINLVT